MPGDRGASPSARRIMRSMSATRTAMCSTNGSSGAAIADLDSPSDCRGLPRFWRALERLPNSQAVLDEWRLLVGQEFTVVEPWLRSTGRLALGYPRHDTTGVREPYRVVSVTLDTWVGVSEED